MLKRLKSNELPIYAEVIDGNKSEMDEILKKMGFNSVGDSGNEKSKGEGFEWKPNSNVAL